VALLLGNKQKLPHVCELNPATVVKCPSVGDTFCVQNQCQPKSGLCDLTAVHQGLACQDATACTTGDVCKNGACSGTLLVCKDGEACTADVCDAVTGCLYPPSDAACNDKNPCTVDVCIPGSGCVYSQSKSACDDGSACTAGDS